jgi:hypothetical protein
MFRRYSKQQSIQLMGILFLGWILFFMGACATFNSPSRSIQPNLLEHTVIEEKNHVRVSAAIVPQKEEETIFGIDLSKKQIQAVWLKIKNDTIHPLFLLPTAIDPEYFTPSEVAWSYKSTFNKKSINTLAEHLGALRFSVKNPIIPGTTRSGYIFTNLTTGTKIINIDLFDRNYIQTFTFFLVSPNEKEGQRLLAFMEALYASHELIFISEESELRKALEKLPCCVSDNEHHFPGGPLNLVIIGEIDAWVTGFIRRGYYYQPLTPRYVFGRSQDISGIKKIRGYTRSQEHFIRVWKTPIVYINMPVWVVQTGTRLGGRFSRPLPEDGTIPVDPHVDGTRNDIVQDLAYSQNLKQIGFVKALEPLKTNETKQIAKVQTPYITDGLRAVMVFSKGPVSLEEIDFLDWEKLVPSSNSNGPGTLQIQ